MARMGLSWKTAGRVDFPFKKLAIITCILLITGSLGVWHTREQEMTRLMSNMRNQAKVLIWALEGGARSMGVYDNNVSPVPQAFVEAIGKQPSVTYVAVLDVTGRALAHSDPRKIGFIPDGLVPEQLPVLAALSVGVLMQSDGRTLYEGVKLFDVPRRGNTQSYMPGEDRYYIVVGLDAETLLGELDTHVWHFAMIVFLVLLTSLGGVIIVFYMQSLTLSTRILQDTQLLASQVFENLPIGVFTTTDSGDLVLCNDSALIILGIQNVHELPKHLKDHPWLDWEDLVRNVRPDTPLLEHELDFTDVHGRTVAVSISVYSVTMADGPKYLFIMRDVFEVKKLQKQLRLNERLTALGDLAAGVAHELRNPLSAVKGYATFFALKLKDNPAMLEKANSLQIEVERLSRVVSDLLGMAKPGEIVLRMEPLVPLLLRSVHLAEQEAAAKNVRLAVLPITTEEEAKLVAEVDADRMVQMTLNLLINAIQASDAGGQVTAALKYVHSKVQGQPDKAVLNITDTGVGIAPEALSNIFTPYFTTKATGTGLGLPIAHRIIEEHGAEVTVSSKPGQGSTFSVLLPIINNKSEVKHA